MPVMLRRSALASAVACLTLVGLFGVPAAAQAGGPFDGDPATTERVDAGTPTDAALAVSRMRFAEGTAAHGVVARDDDFADALAASALLGDGPLLLTPTGALLPEVHDELVRTLRPNAAVYVLGGEQAMSTTVEQQLAERWDVTRLAGPTRIDTAVEVAREVVRLQGFIGTVVVVRAFGTATDPSAAWADSITGGAWAAAQRIPVLVTPTEQLAPQVAAELDALQPTRTVLFGGAAALSAAVEAAVPNPHRVWGPSRVETAAEIAGQLWESVDGYLLVNGYRPDGWGFGLAAAGLGASATAPVLFVIDDDVPPATLARLGAGCASGPPRVETAVVGDASILSATVVEQVDRHDGGPCPPPPLYAAPASAVLGTIYDFTSDRATLAWTDIDTGATTTLGIDGFGPGWSPDRTRIAYAGDDGGIWVTNADGNNPHPIVTAHPEYYGDFGPVWSPDGTTITFLRGRDLNTNDFPTLCDDVWQVNADGSSPRPVYRFGMSVLGMDASPDGSQLVFTLGGISTTAACDENSPGGMFIGGVDGTGLRSLGMPFSRSPSWSPDGTRIVFGDWRNTCHACGEVWIVNADGTGQRRLFPAPDDQDGAPVWSPDGSRIAFRRGDGLWVADASGAGQRPVGGAVTYPSDW